MTAAATRRGTMRCLLLIHPTLHMAIVTVMTTAVGCRPAENVTFNRLNLFWQPSAAGDTLTFPNPWRGVSFGRNPCNRNAIEPQSYSLEQNGRLASASESESLAANSFDEATSGVRTQSAFASSPASLCESSILKI